MREKRIGVGVVVNIASQLVVTEAKRLRLLNITVGKDDSGLILVPLWDKAWCCLYAIVIMSLS